MDRLTSSWLTDGVIDFEYKKYVLLAYLKRVKKRFNKGQLYPKLGELTMHYQNLLNFKETKSLYFSQFPKRLKKIDLEKLKMVYERIIEDDDLMAEIEEIVAFSLPKIKKQLDEGKEIYEFVEENLDFESVGIVPLYDKEGYLFFREENAKEVALYQYSASLFRHEGEDFHSLKTEFLRFEHISITNSPQQIKWQLIQQNKTLPNPATFLFTYKIQFPLTETVMPVAKRRLLRELKFAA